MPQTIFDILTTSRPEETASEYLPPEEELVRSVRDHLQRLLNARRGSLTHLPQYGMPDIAALYLALPYSRDTIMACIRQCLTEFEPRFRHPHIRSIVLDNGLDVTQFELVGESPLGHRLKFITSLYRNGSIRVTAAGEYVHHG